MAQILLDGLDKRLRNDVKENPGVCVRQIIKPYFLERSEPVLRRRMEMLAMRGLIRCVKTKRDVLCFPIENDNEKRRDEL